MDHMKPNMWAQKSMYLAQPCLYYLHTNNERHNQKRLSRTCCGSDKKKTVQRTYVGFLQCSLVEMTTPDVR